ncbi:trypsin-like serine peptidase [Sphaerisporangium corydalis]|uniref:Trypsin-like serine peptidase n=1 Tax=Sphaerisporangium corydalis TaxID=1441875 RepID=A0ABV9EHT4_9ACTN|nr:serine protease [Sphaerisporangium corydalis]
MPSRAKRIALTFCGALATASVILSAGPGFPGALASSRSAPAGITTLPLAQNDADLNKVVEWWTPDRLKHASSYAPKTASAAPAATSSATPSATSPVPKPTATSNPGAASLTPASAEAGRSTKAPESKTTALLGSPPPKTSLTVKSKNVNLPPTVGKVFFRNGTTEYWCSASSVHSKYGNVVATAGHCAYDVKSGKPVDYWVFIPSYIDGATPYGIYVGHTLYINDTYAATGDFDFDYAFVTVHHGYRWDPDKNADGTPKKDPTGQPVYKSVDTGRLETRVGGQGFAWNRGFTVAAYAFGYPAGPHPNGSRPFTGRTMQWCLTRATRKISTQKWELDNGVMFGGCGFTAGASGGPWVIKYSGTRRIGYLNGVNSLTWDLDGDGRYDGVSSPYFNTATYAVYSYAGRQKTD